MKVALNSLIWSRFITYPDGGTLNIFEVEAIEVAEDGGWRGWVLWALTSSTWFIVVELGF